MMLLAIAGITFLILTGTGALNTRSNNPEKDLEPDGPYYHTRVTKLPGGLSALNSRMRIGVRTLGTITNSEYEVSGDSNSNQLRSLTIFKLDDPTDYTVIKNSSAPQNAYYIGMPVPTDNYKGNGPMHIACSMHPTTTLNDSNHFSGHVTIFSEDGKTELQKIDRENQRPWDIGYDLVNDTMYVLWLELNFCHVVAYKYKKGSWKEESSLNHTLGNIRPINLVVTRYTMYVVAGLTGKVHVLRRTGTGYNSKSIDIIQATTENGAATLAESADGKLLAVGNYVFNSSSGHVKFFERSDTKSPFHTTATSEYTEGTGELVGANIAFIHNQFVLATRNVLTGGLVKVPTIYDVKSKIVTGFPNIAFSHNVGLAGRFFDEDEKRFHYYLFEDRAITAENGEAFLHHFTAPARRVSS